MRPTFEQLKEGWTKPELTEEQMVAHENSVIPYDVGAISVGLIDGKSYLDLDYILDSNADVDMNVVALANGDYIEVQGTGEESSYSRDEFNALLDMAEIGMAKISAAQKASLDGIQ
jgi:ribonuclease PH